MKRLIDLTLLGIGMICLGLSAYTVSKHPDFTLVQISSVSFLCLSFIFSVVSIWLFRPTIKIGIIAVFISSSFTLYCMELVTNILPEPNPFELYAKKNRIQFDKRTPSEYMRDNRLKKINLYPRYGGANFIQAPILINSKPAIPFAGVSSVLSFIKAENGKFFKYQSDRHGFNNPDSAWDKPKLDILSIGDSFTFGSAVELSESFMSLLRSRFPNTLNLGQCGIGPLMELSILKEYAPQFKPKTVFWFYYEGNDLEDLNHEKSNSILMQYLVSDKIQNLSSCQDQIDQAIKERIAYEDAVLKKRKPNYGFIESLKLRKMRQRFGLLLNEPPDFQLFEKVITEAKETVSKWNGKLVFVYIPAWARYAQEADFNRNEVLELIEKLQIPVVDIHQAFEEKTDPLQFFPWRLNGHYNEWGNLVVANELVNFIEKE